MVQFTSIYRWVELRQQQDIQSTDSSALDPGTSLSEIATWIKIARSVETTAIFLEHRKSINGENTFSMLPGIQEKGAPKEAPDAVTDYHPP
jgi:hypothetical protein